MTAEERGMEMMLIPLGQLPVLARKFAKKLASEVGLCGEVYLTAWTSYAQCIEDLECTDALYMVHDTDRQWFEDNKESDGEGYPDLF